MSEPYDAQLRLVAQEVARDAAVPLQHGVYICLAGPSFETPADLRFLRGIGVDAVGMSIVPEVTVARHAGTRVLGLSGITNIAVVDGPPSGETTHEEVLEAGTSLAPRMMQVIRGVLRQTMTIPLQWPADNVWIFYVACVSAPSSTPFRRSPPSVSRVWQCSLERDRARSRIDSPGFVCVFLGLGVLIYFLTVRVLPGYILWVPEEATRGLGCDFWNLMDEPLHSSSSRLRRLSLSIPRFHRRRGRRGDCAGRRPGSGTDCRTN